MRCVSGAADTGSLRARALGEHGMVLCAAAEYLRQQPAPQTIAGLNEHRTLGYLHNGQLQNGNCMTRSRAKCASVRRRG